MNRALTSERLTIHLLELADGQRDQLEKGVLPRLNRDPVNPNPDRGE
jgi:hypothetical protein